MTIVKWSRFGERLASVCPGTAWHSAVPTGRVTLKIPDIMGRNGTGRYGPVRVKPRISALLISGFGVQVPDGAQIKSPASHVSWAFVLDGAIIGLDLTVDLHLIGAVMVM